MHDGVCTPSAQTLAISFFAKCQITTGIWVKGVLIRRDLNANHTRGNAGGNNGNNVSEGSRCQAGSRLRMGRLLRGVFAGMSGIAYLPFATCFGDGTGD